MRFFKTENTTRSEWLFNLINYFFALIYFSSLLLIVFWVGAIFSYLVTPVKNGLFDLLLVFAVGLIANIASVWACHVSVLKIKSLNKNNE